MDKVNTLLAYLDNAGIGNPTKINNVLIELYPHSQNFQDDQEHKDYGTRVENFLDALKKANLITYRKEGSFRAKIAGKYLTLNDCNVFAAITYEGSKSLHDASPTSINYLVNIGGSFTGTLAQGEGNPIQTFSEPKKSEKPKWLTLNFYWEELIKYWYKLILGIIGVILLSWLGIKLFTNKSPNTQQNKLDEQVQNDNDTSKSRNINDALSISKSVTDSNNIIYLQSYRPVELFDGNLILTLNNSIEAVNQEIDLKISRKDSLKNELLKNKQIGDVIKFDKYFITLLSLEKNIQLYDLLIRVESKN